MSQVIASPSKRLPVLIIGSGLGGLTLAHSLQKHHIPYKLFERDASNDRRAQGYRVSIDSSGSSGLKSAVTPEMFEQFEKSCGEQHPVGGRIDAVSGKVLQKGVLGMIGAGGIGMVSELMQRLISKRLKGGTVVGLAKWATSFVYNPTPITPQPLTVPLASDKHYQVDRRVLRSLLLTSQTQHMTHSAQFVTYTSYPDRVVAHFSNGTSATGSLLVGADGINSAVARQLIGDNAKPEDMGVRIVYGKTPLTSEVDNQLHETLRKGTSFVVDPEAGRERGEKGLLLVQECMRFHHPSAPADYIFWALAGRKEIFEAVSTDDSPQTIAKILSQNWHPSIRIVITASDPNETAILKMTTSSTSGLPTWDTDRRVTVLGDAIHCMPPTGGQGANAAMHDAALLGLSLAKENEADGDRDGWSKETIGAYEKGIKENIGDVVALACIGAKRIMGAEASGI